MEDLKLVDKIKLLPNLEKKTALDCLLIKKKI